MLFRSLNDANINGNINENINGNINGNFNENIPRSYTDYFSIIPENSYTYFADSFYHIEGFLKRDCKMWMDLEDNIDDFENFIQYQDLDGIIYLSNNGIVRIFFKNINYHEYIDISYTNNTPTNSPIFSPITNRFLQDEINNTVIFNLNSMQIYDYNKNKSLHILMEYEKNINLG